MSCKVSLEKLEDTLKQLAEQQTSMANDIRLKDLDLSQTKESYLKVEGALEIISIIETKISEEAKDDTVAEVVGSS